MGKNKHVNELRFVQWLVKIIQLQCAYKDAIRGFSYLVMRLLG